MIFRIAFAVVAFAVGGTTTILATIRNPSEVLYDGIVGVGVVPDDRIGAVVVNNAAKSADATTTTTTAKGADATTATTTTAKEDAERKTTTTTTIAADDVNDQRRPEQQQQQQQQLEKPTPKKKPRYYAVIHVGPHKTGSTSVQRFLFKQHRSPPSTAAGGGGDKNDDDHDDGYDLAWIESGRPGYKNLASFAVCLNRDETEVATEGNLKTWCVDPNAAKADFDRSVAVAVSNGRHLVASSEEFDRRMLDVDWLKDHLDTGHFEVRIVLYHRRFHEWLGSYLNELAKKAVESGRPVPDVRSWLNDNLIPKSEQHAAILRRRYADAFGEDAVTVLDFHDTTESLEESFACRGMPNAPSTCALARKQRKKEEEEKKKAAEKASKAAAGGGGAQNERVSLDWPRILMDLEELRRRRRNGADGGKLTVEQKKIALRRWKGLEAKHSGSTVVWMDGDDPGDLDDPDDVPPLRRICPSREKALEILNLSKRFDEELKGILSKSSSSSSKSSSTTNETYSAEEDFWGQFHKTFCVLDTDRVLRHWERMPWFRETILLEGSNSDNRNRVDGGNATEATRRP